MADKERINLMRLTPEKLEELKKGFAPCKENESDEEES